MDSARTHQPLPTKVLAGMLDSGLSSIATFVIGVIAIRNLSPTGLGVYSVLFSAYLFGSLVPAEGYFLPRSLTSMKLDPDRRLAGIGNAMVGSLRHGLIGAIVVIVAVLVVGRNESASLLVPEALATIGIIIVAPMQDYLRISFHLAERSGRAAIVSAIQLLAVVGLYGAASLSHIPVEGLPLVLLFGAKCISLAIGLTLTGGVAGHGIPTVDPDIDGRATLRSALLLSGPALVGALIMTRLVGPVVVGYAEAARTLGQPVVVVGVGLLAAVSSRSLTHIQARDQGAVRRVNRRYLAMLAVTAAVFLLPLAFGGIRAWLADLLPAAFAVDGLIVATVVANVAFCSTFLAREQLIKGGVAAAMARIDGLSASVPVVASLASPALGAFARPVGLAGQNAVRLIGFRGLWPAVFPEGPDVQNPEVSTESQPI